MPFTSAETAEVVKVVQAAELLGQASNIVADAVGSVTTRLSPTESTKYYIMSTDINGQAAYINYLLQELLYAYEQNTAHRNGRAISLSRAWTDIDNIVKTLNSGINNGIKFVPDAANAVPFIQQAITLLSSIDRTLPYASPFPEDYPAVIGPHGNYDLAQAAAALSRKYIIEAVTSVAQFMFSYPNSSIWPVNANPMMGTMMKGTAATQALWTRIMAMTAGVVTPEDQALIDAETAKGSGLRPNTFFRLIFAHELALVGGNPPFATVSGRQVQPGISFHYGDVLASGSQIITEFSKVVAPTDPRIYNQLYPGAGFFGDVGRAWRSLDQWADLVFLFFFEIPAAPVGSTPVQ